MKTIILKTICILANGDRKVDATRKVVSDIEVERKAVKESTLNCVAVEFMYQQF